MLNRFIYVTVFCVLCSVNGLQAQADYAISAPAASGLPNSTVNVAIQLDTPTDAQGFQFGLSHLAPTLMPATVDQGSALMVTNNGQGADFFTIEMNPMGGPGLVVGAIVSLSPPLESVLAGVHEIAVINYSVDPNAMPGTTSALAFLNTLGDPPVNCVISVNGVSQQPILNHGSFTIETPAPTNVSVTIDDACDCSATLSWTNGASYEALEVTQGGVTTSLPGTATSLPITLSDGIATDFSVVGISLGQASAAAIGTGTCIQTPASPGPSGLSCDIDHETCTATLTWFNNDPGYQDLALLVDGVLAATLPGDATTVSVTLAAEMVEYALVISGTGACGETLPSASCLAMCLPERFRRGDVNSDGTLDISDAIGTLNYLFQNLAVVCLDGVDSNDDGAVDISDAISILNYIFAGGPPPADPGPTDCGVDTTDDLLDCSGYDTSSCN